MVEVRGEVDIVNAQRLRQVLADASSRRPAVILVDLLRVTFIDSTGTGALVAGCNSARGLGVRFAVWPASPFVVAQLRQTGLYGTLAADR